ncbi:MAG TPA: serine/threonine-protein kinase, partial [Candidatus Eisenbacteria bacterium]|nr:serine/threonine-protein kinase [Candidatus Eisenbacteria bacterium]
MDDLLSRLQTALADRYAVETEIGRGGMSTVYLARDLRHDRRVALKVLDPALGERVGTEAFLHEMQVTARLQHPLILPLHDSGSADGLLYYVMPFVEGETLRDRLRREGQLPVADAVRIAREIAEALAYAHEKNVMHRDIKPENILLTGGHPLVADFGIARAVQLAEDRTIRAGEGVSGTPAYMSPEQAMGEPGDARSDVYSLGCVLYEMLTGNPPFVEPTISALMKRVLVEPPVPVRNHRDSIPEGLAEVVHRSLAKIPADRWGTAAELGAALSTAQQTERSIPAVTGPPPSTGVFILRAAGLLLAFAMGSFLVLFLVRVLMQQLGLPDWVLPATMVVLAVGLPVLLATLFIQDHVRRVRSGSVTHRWFTWRNAVLGGALAFFGLALLVSGYMVSRKTGIGPGASLVSSGVLDERDRILIADFQNSPGDSLLGRTLKEALSVDMAQSPSVTVVPSAQIVQALLRMQRDPHAPLTPDLASELAIREGIKGVLVGDLSPLGTGYVLSAKLLSSQNGDVLVAHREGADGPEELIGAVDRLSKKLRERIGESLKSIRANKPLEQVTTNSLSALTKYSQAIAVTEMGGDQDRAIALLNEAVALDTTFAMAYRKLATVLGNFDRDPVKVYEATMKAFRLRERLPDRERYLTEGSYYRFLNENDKAATSYQKILEMNPGDSWALNNLGVVYTDLGNPARALEYYRRAYAASPSALSLGNIVDTEFRLGRDGDAEKSLQEYGQKYPDAPQTGYRRVMMSSARGDYDLAEKETLEALELMKQSPFFHGQIQGGLGFLKAIRGRLDEAERYWRQGALELREAGDPESSLGVIFNLILADVFLREDPRRAQDHLEEILAEVPLQQLTAEERPYLEFVAVYAMVGNVARSRELLSEYEASVPSLIRKSQEEDLHRAMGTVAMAEHRLDDALHAF